jgi:hypothetical protein
VVLLYTGRFRTVAYEMNLDAGGPGAQMNGSPPREGPGAISRFWTPFPDYVWYILAGKTVQRTPEPAHKAERIDELGCPLHGVLHSTVWSDAAMHAASKGEFIPDLKTKARVCP